MDIGSLSVVVTLAAGIGTLALASGHPLWVAIAVGIVTAVAGCWMAAFDR